MSVMECGKEGVEKWREDWGLKGNQHYEGHGVFEKEGMGTSGALCVMEQQQQRWMNRKGMGSNDLVPHVLFPLRHFDLTL